MPKKTKIKEYKVYLDGRCYEVSHSNERLVEVICILNQLYPNSEISFERYDHFE